MSESLWPHELEPACLLCPRNYLGNNTGVGRHVLLQGMFPNQGLNLGLLHCRQIFYHLSHQGSPVSSYDWSTIHFLMICLTKIKDKDFLRWCSIWYPEALSSVQSLSHVRLFATPWTAARQASLSITNSQSLLKLMSIKSVMPSNHLILYHPLLLLPLIFPSIRVFSNESALCIRWPKYWSFRCNISPTNELPGLISFRMNWLDLHAVQGTLKSLLQHHSSKASILWRSAFFIV